MPNSLKCRIKKLAHEGKITEKESNELILKLDGHDADLLNKVMQKQRTIIDDDGVMHRVVLVKDIEELKGETE